jgi:ABC-2 type transport system permease protein
MRSLKRILTVLRRDLRAAVRDYVVAYMLFAPFLLALILRLFIPVASDAGIRLVADSSVTGAAVDQMATYAVVERAADRDALARRVRGPDDALGVVFEEGGYRLVAQGNEREELLALAGQVIAAVSGDEPSGGLAVTTTDLGETRAPAQVYGTASILLLAAMLGGMVAGLSVIEEKEGRTLTVLAVTPLGKAEYLTGKGLIGIVVPLFQAAVLVPFMGAGHVHMGQLLYLMLCTTFTSLVLGFFLGAVSPSQIAGIANLKFMFLVITASFLGAILAPATWQWALYWSPFYWSAAGFIEVLEGEATWTSVLPVGLIVIALSGALFLALAGKIRRGLTPAGI